MTVDWVGWEAKCTRCGETFCPSGEDDLVHLGRLDGQECGGQGVMMGRWGTPKKEQDNA